MYGFAFSFIFARTTISDQNDSKEREKEDIERKKGYFILVFQRERLEEKEDISYIVLQKKDIERKIGYYIWADQNNSKERDWKKKRKK